MSLSIAKPSTRKPIPEEAANWLVNDLSTQAPHWYSWPPGSGEQFSVVPLKTSRSIVDVSAHGSLIISLGEESAKTQRLWKQVSSPPIRTARTDLGKRLWEIRQKILASGEPLLDWNDIERELRERRGEQDLEEPV